MNLEYEEFVSEFLEALKDSIPEADFERIKVQKVNETKDAVKVHLPEFAHITPTAYLDDLYQTYQMGNLPEAIAKQMVQNLSTSVKKMREAVNFDKDTAKERLFPCIINKEMNKKLLDDIPHRDIEGTDLTLIARYKIGDIGEQSATCIISNNNASAFGLNPEEALGQAIANGSQEKYVCKGISEFLADEMRKIGATEDMIKGFYSPEKELCYMLTNEKMMNGASVVAYPNEIRQAIRTLGEERCYVLPSSIHEVLLIPESVAIASPKELEEMVKEVNENDVAANEKLSNHVYFFDGNNLCIADTQAVDKKVSLASSMGKGTSKGMKKSEKSKVPTR